MNGFSVELLREYDSLKIEILEKQARVNEIEQAVKRYVSETGAEVAAYGWRGYMKPGRKRIDHEGAAKAASVDPQIVAEFTTVPAPRIAWAKVTKKAQLNKDFLAEYTSQSAPTFALVSA